MSKKSAVAAVFLDRDGVINEEVGHISDPRHLRYIPHVARAIRKLNERAIPVVVVSNQSGVARGYHTDEQVEIIHEAISAELKKEGARIDRFYYCPHHPTEGKGAYLVECDCRKPRPGLLLQAAKELHLDLPRCVMIGDKKSDIEAGHAVGTRTILVLTGDGTTTHASWRESFKPTHVAHDLHEAVEWFLSDAD